MNIQLTPPSPMDFSASTDVALKWEKFKEAFANYEIAIGLDKEADRRRVATFLHVIGELGVEKYNILSWDQDGDKYKIDKVLKKFDVECSPRSNIIMERYKFLKRKQESNESCDQFITQLRILCKTCNYDNEEEMIRDQFILNLHDDKAREKLLDHVQMDTKPMTLERAVNFVKNYEMRVQQKQQMTSSNTEEEEVNVVGKKKNKYTNPRNKPKSSNAKEIKDCRYCGRTHKIRMCPAYGQVCAKCKRRNHYAKQCKTNWN
ncbi:uncharacterized protein [Macrobrachium rosenbergii]|uniref:uncharacterized protein n=1 Tax=Macrobrachium rosenbergii TaxID=79674 RepID=UPI0034D3CC78